MINPKKFRRWTRHSLVLTVAGVIYIAIGLAFFSAPPMAAKDPSLKIALQWLSFNDWGFIFVFVGLLSVLSSSWPMGSEKWGYSVLTGLSAGWGSFYVSAVIFAHAPKIGLLGGLTWGLLAFIWWAVSGLTSPEFIMAVKPNDPD